MFRHVHVWMMFTSTLISSRNKERINFDFQRIRIVISFSRSWVMFRANFPLYKSKDHVNVPQHSNVKPQVFDTFRTLRSFLHVLTMTFQLDLFVWSLSQRIWVLRGRHVSVCVCVSNNNNSNFTQQHLKHKVRFDFVLRSQDLLQLVWSQKDRIAHVLNSVWVLCRRKNQDLDPS